MAPTHYDPSSPDEQVVALPSAPLVALAANAVLQPPLSRRGTGPGLIALLPPATAFTARTRVEKALDPEPVQKWAEEGFAVVGVTTSKSGWSVSDAFKKGIDALLELKELDTKDKFAVVGKILAASGRFFVADLPSVQYMIQTSSTPSYPSSRRTPGYPVL